MKSVHLAGVDVTDTPLDFRNGDIDGLEIELTQRLTTLSGTVSDDRGAMVLDGRVRGMFNGRLVTAPRRRSSPIDALAISLASIVVSKGELTLVHETDGVPPAARPLREPCARPGHGPETRVH